MDPSKKLTNNRNWKDDIPSMLVVLVIALVIGLVLALLNCEPVH